MEDIFLSAEMGDSRRICISSISKNTYRNCVGSGLGGDAGYFIFETNDDDPASGLSVLGKVTSYEAALRIFDVLTSKKA